MHPIFLFDPMLAAVTRLGFWPFLATFWLAAFLEGVLGCLAWQRWRSWLFLRQITRNSARLQAALKWPE
jgi:hypothetical protein